MTLNPDLFHDQHLITGVRSLLRDYLQQFLAPDYPDSGRWVTAAWLTTFDHPNLEVVVGVDFTAARQAQAAFRALSDSDIAEHLNEYLSTATVWWSPDQHAERQYQVRWYVNRAGLDITALRPPAAINLFTGQWDVEVHDRHSVPDDWRQAADRQARMAHDVVRWYSRCLSELQSDRVDKSSSQEALSACLAQAQALRDRVAAGRDAAFAAVGYGYVDPYYYQWQRAQEWWGPITQLCDYADQLAAHAPASSSYGVEAPSVQQLTQRAVAQYRRSS